MNRDQEIVQRSHSFREQYRKETPSWYRGEMHLAFTLLFTGGGYTVEFGSAMPVLNVFTNVATDPLAVAWLAAADAVADAAPAEDERTGVMMARVRGAVELEMGE